jgi:adenine phosphoribosyltransferase
LDLKKFIRDIPDFPRKGIVFRDITPLLAHKPAFEQVIDAFTDLYNASGVTKVVAIESRGFIFGAPVALSLGAGFVPCRKKGKLPFKTYAMEYALEYGTDTVEIHQDAIEPGDKVLLVDDLIATGGTALATLDLVKRIGGDIVAAAFLIELEYLRGRERLADYPTFSLIKY